MSLAAYASKTNKAEDERMKQQSKREYEMPQADSDWVNVSSSERIKVK